MLAATLVLATLSLGQIGRPATNVAPKEVEYQNQTFQRWWDTDLEWTYDDLPMKGSISIDRLPYSGHDYPDASGGTLRSLRVYDQAFHPNTFAASAHEQRDIARDRNVQVQRRGLFGRRTFEVNRTPHWYGHCNGWAAAAIRHGEPQSVVIRNGVKFTPADIKGLLAELYMYTPAEFLGGLHGPINPGLLHVVLCNWLGRGRHPIAMETALGDEVWNYPVYAYATSHADLEDGHIELKMNLAYAGSTRQEFDQSPRVKRVMYFHYLLNVDEDRKITGGSYYGDSARIDILWTPLAPIQGGSEGNREGNPHLKAKEVLAIWRDSVAVDAREKWLNIDPPVEDQVEVEE
jgi:hypothetical protein